MFKILGNILRFSGTGFYRLSGILPAQKNDEVVNFEQLLNVLGINSTEIFTLQTIKTTLSFIPKNDRNIFVSINSGNGYNIVDPINDYTIDKNIITWTPSLEGISVMVKYTY